MSVGLARLGFFYFHRTIQYKTLKRAGFGMVRATTGHFGKRLRPFRDETKTRMETSLAVAW